MESRPGGTSDAKGTVCPYHPDVGAGSAHGRLASDQQHATSAYGYPCVGDRDRERASPQERAAATVEGKDGI